MFRRCLASMLLVGYLANLLAMVPHAHAAMHEGHDDHHARPHVHIGLLFEQPSAPHRHGEHTHHGHSHHGDHHHDCHPVDGSGSPHAPADPPCTEGMTSADQSSVVTGTTGFNHDADCVYTLQSPVSPVSTVSSLTLALDDITFSAAMLCNDSAGSNGLTSSHSPAAPRFPADCGLFLKLRNLRI